MIYTEHIPAKGLQQYIKCYYSLEYEYESVIEDYAFATGCIEVMFTLEGNVWETSSDGSYSKTSEIGAWGQILKPLMFKVPGRSKVFGIRFYPAAASFFLKENISNLNDQVIDLTNIIGNGVSELHARLQEAKSVVDQVAMVNRFLLKKLEGGSKIIDKIDLVQRVMAEMSQKDFFDNIANVAERYGITSRYLQKVFVQYSGLTPKLYAKINRFQNSLVLLGEKDGNLTSVAYESGYFDQSHFIREFKLFTGTLPSSFEPANTTAIMASPNK